MDQSCQKKLILDVYKKLEKVNEADTAIDNSNRRV